MAKGSQLTQLKSALSHVGLSGDSRKRKRTTSTGKEKERQKSQLEAINRRFNAFDTKETKLKHDVLGKGKIKGQKGNPTKSNQAGLEARKKTLLKEWEDRHHTGTIVDRRFGENDPSMSLEDKMLERFTRERQRASRGDIFNLEDEEELTHYGQNLSNLDDFDHVGLGDEDDEEDQTSGQINRDVVRKTHFGGFGDDAEEEGQPPRKKSKAEVMAEVMAKSKEYKLQRQINRQQDDNIRHQLDQEFDSLRSLLVAVETQPTPSTSKDTVPVEPSPSSQPEAYAKDSTYDSLVKELAFDARSQPKDRTKTEEELALEESEKLLKAEKRRRLAMLGLPFDEDDNETSGTRRKKRRRDGDNLDDDFEGGYDDDDWTELGKGIGGHNTEQGDAENWEGIDGAEGDDEEEDGDDDEEEDSGEEEDGSEASGEQHAPAYSAGDELPYRFPCPKNHKEFLSIVKNISDADVPTVVKRIRALHHPSLAPNNKFKLQTFIGILLDHILYVAPNMHLVTALLPHLAALTKQYPRESADHFITQLSKIQESLQQSVSDSSLPLRMELADLTLFRIISLVFPTSDLHHLVISPARLLLGAYLSLGLSRLRDTKDVAAGLFVTTLILEWEESVSKRWVPEVPTFLANVLVRMSPRELKVADLPGTFPLPNLDVSRKNLPLQKHRVQGPLPKPNLCRLLSEEENQESDIVALLGLSITLIERFAEMYKDLEAFIEVFEPFYFILGKLTDELEGELKNRIVVAKDRIAKMVSISRKSRQPLRLQAHKPIPLPSHAPQFSEKMASSYLHRDDPDKEANKLRKAYQQERKGAIRELRKDTRFLAKVEQDQQKEKDKQYQTKMRRVFGSIEGERSEEKAMEREKMKEKRRAGRK